MSSLPITPASEKQLDSVGIRREAIQGYLIALGRYVDALKHLNDRAGWDFKSLIDEGATSKELEAIREIFTREFEQVNVPSYLHSAFFK